MEQNMAGSDAYSMQIRPMTAACTLIPRHQDNKKQDRERVQTSPRDQSKLCDTIATKMSSLTLGNGKITHVGNIDKLELHFDNKDFSSLITQRLRPSDRFSVIREINTDQAKGTKLPKTFVTRSGSLFLYSDSKIMKDTAQSRKTNSDATSFCMKGLRMTQNRDLKTSWKKYLTHSPRQIKAIDMTCLCSIGHDYEPSSRYQRRGPIYRTRVKPKPFDLKDEKTTEALSNETGHILSVDTVKELSNALLEYRLKQLTDRERYENTVINAWDGTSYHSDKSVAPSKRKLSASTLGWLQTSRRRSKVQEVTTDTEKHYLLLQRAKTDLSLAWKGVVPTNTPYSNNDKKGFCSKEKDQ